MARFSLYFWSSLHLPPFHLSFLRVHTPARGETINGNEFKEGKKWVLETNIKMEVSEGALAESVAPVVVFFNNTDKASND